MKKRLQVRFGSDELKEIRQTATRQRLTVAAWVHRALREALHRERLHSVEDKLVALADAVQHNFPTGDVETMLAEVQAGYLADR